jgi:hypothetical protein
MSGDPNQQLFKGRQVSEHTGTGTNYDNCWFPGSSIPTFSSVQGSLWNVGYYGVDPPYITSADVWADDYIGWNTNQVSWYRVHLTPSSFPCAARVPQAMNIGKSGTSGHTNNYSNGYVMEQLYLDHVVSTRNGVSQTAYR